MPESVPDSLLEPEKKEYMEKEQKEVQEETFEQTYGFDFDATSSSKPHIQGKVVSLSFSHLVEPLRERRGGGLSPRD